MFRGEYVTQKDDRDDRVPVATANVQHGRNVYGIVYVLYSTLYYAIHNRYGTGSESGSRSSHATHSISCVHHPATQQPSMQYAICAKRSIHTLRPTYSRIPPPDSATIRSAQNTHPKARRRLPNTTNASYARTMRKC